MTQQMNNNDLVSGFNAATDLHPLTRPAQTIRTVTSLLPNTSTWKDRIEEIKDVSRTYRYAVAGLNRMTPIKSYNPSPNGNRTITIIERFSTIPTDNFEWKNREPDESTSFAFPPITTHNYISKASVRFYHERSDNEIRMAIKTKLDIVMLYPVSPDRDKHYKLFEGALEYLSKINEANPQMLNSLFGTPALSDLITNGSSFFDDASSLIPNVLSTTDKLNSFVDSMTKFIDSNETIYDVVKSSSKKFAQDCGKKLPESSLPVLSLLALLTTSANLVYSKESTKYYYFVLAVVCAGVACRQQISSFITKIGEALSPHFGVNAQAGGDESDGILASLVRMLLNIFTDMPRIPKSWIDLIGNFDRVNSGLLSIFTLFVKIITRISKGAGIDHLIPDGIKYFFYNNEEVVEYMKEVDKIQEAIRIKTFHVSYVNYLTVKSLVIRGRKILLNLPAQSKSGGAYGIMQEQVRILVKIKDTFAMSNFDYDGRRVEPVSCILAGGPGNGKTEATDHLIAAVAAATSSPEDLEKFKTNSSGYIYVVPTENAFWDNYKVQRFCLFNDFMQTTDVAGVASEAIKWIHAKDTTPYILNQAHLEDKGNVIFGSSFMFATTNLSTFRVPSIMCADALRRRFDFSYVAVIKEAYSKPFHRIWDRKIDPSRLPVGEDGVTRLHVDMMDFYPYCFYTGNIVGESLSFDVVVRKIADRYILNQQRFDQKSKELQKTINLFTKPLYVSMENGEPHVVIPPVTVTDTGLRIGNVLNMEPIIEAQGICDLLGEVAHQEGNLDEAVFDVEYQLSTSATQYISRVLSFINENPTDHETRKILLWCVDYQDYIRHEYGVININIIASLGMAYNFSPTSMTLIQNDLLFPCLIPYDEAMLATLDPVLTGFTLPVASPDFFEPMNYATWFFTGNKLIWFQRFCISIGVCTVITDIARFTCALGSMLQSSLSKNEATEELVVDDPNEIVYEEQPDGSIIEVEAQYQAKIKDKHNVRFVNKSKEVKAQYQTKMKANTPRTPRVVSSKSSINAQMGYAYDANGDEIISRVMKKNYYGLFVRKDSTRPLQKLGHILFVKDNIGLIPHHFISFFNQAIESDYDAMTPNSEVILSRFSENSFIPHTYITVRDLISHTYQEGGMANRDLVIVQIMHKRILTHADITKFFPTVEHISKLPIKIPVSIKLTSEKDMSVYNSVGTLTRLATVKQEGFEPYSIESCIAYVAASREGDCGALCCVQNSNCEAKIFGMHTCGNTTTTTGFSSVIDRDDILACIAQTNSVQSAVPQYNGHIDYLPPSMESIGKVEKSIYASRQSKICPSKLHETYAETDYGVAVMTFEAYKKALNKYNKPPLQISMDIIDVTVNSLFDSLNNTAVTPNVRRTLTFEEAVFGIEGSTCYSAISRTTSPGYPFVLDRKAGQTAKERYFGKGEDFHITEEGYKIKDMCEKVVENFGSNIRMTCFFTDNLKDETRPISKIEACKTRLFSGVDLVNYLLTRQYFGAFVEWMTLNRIENSIAVGINPFSTEWHSIAMKYFSIITEGERGFTAGDFSGFDTSGKREVYLTICDHINAWYGKDHPDNHIRSMLMIELVQSRHIYQDQLYEWEMCLPSGHPLTVYINSLYNLFAIRYCWFKAHDFVESSLIEFDECTYYIVYGDDINGVVAEHKRDIFNEYVIQENMKDLQLTYTSDSKGEFEDTFRFLDDITFLKRKWLYNKLENIYVAPMCMATLINTPQWTKRGILRDQITRDNVDTVLTELSLWDKETFDTFSKKLIEASIKYLDYSPKCTRQSTLYSKARLLDAFM